MKTTVYFKQFLPALATLVTVGFASSCQDQNFDWDAARANTAQEKFTNVFVKEFGKPAEGHQWGFDMPWAVEKSTTKGGTRAGTFTLKKVSNEEMDNIVANYGIVEDIKQLEHEEVYKWFTYHQVTWKYTTKESEKAQNNFTSGNDNDRVPLADCVYYGQENYTGPYTLHGVPDGGRSRDLIGSCVEIGNQNFGTMETNMPASWLHGNNIPVATEIDFSDAWIQHVASNIDSEDSSFKGDDRANNGDYVTSQKMQQLHVLSDTGIDLSNGSHTFDFNEGLGYGWFDGWIKKTGKKPDTAVDSNHNVYENNGNLAINANFNNLMYHCNVDGNYHDKWILVYLKGGNKADGTDYEGWYLGFDLEAGGEYGNQQLHANGICNDWIVKLSIPALQVDEYNARVMCEDLGGKYGTTSTDIDYNDIVYDVDYECMNGYSTGKIGTVTVTLQAAGGTLPIYLRKGTTDLFEAHTLLIPNIEAPDRYKTMINTGTIADNPDAKTCSAEPQKFTLFFNTNTSINNGEIYDSANPNQMYFNESIPSTKADFKNFLKNTLCIYVYRFDTDVYEEGETGIASWIKTSNEEGEAPVQLCVPQGTKWLKERQKIDLGYPNFRNWVKTASDTEGEVDVDSPNKSWTSTTVATYLY